MTAASFGIAGLRLGEIVIAERFDHSEPLPIKIVTGRVPGGGAAHILKGEIQSPDPRADLPLLVAIKVILTLCPDNVDREWIRRELAAVEHAQHPYILPFIGSLTTDGYTILVSRFMENGNMLEYIKANPAANKGRLIFHVADAVKHLHETLGLVHGDLKCQNVLISEEGDGLLADFGLSTTIREPFGGEATATDIRRTNTRRFAAPELFIDGAKSPSGRIRSKTTQTDVYAFGMFIIQAFTKTHPWPDLDDYGIRSKLFNREPYPRPANSAEIGFNDPWWQLCQACFRFEPKERPTMGEIHLQLRTILGSTQEGEWFHHRLQSLVTYHIVAPKVEKKIISEGPMNTASSSDDLNPAFSDSPQRVPKWVIAAQGANPDISTVNPDTLASVFGVLDSDGIREVDDKLKLILVGVHRGLTKLSDRSWGALTQFLSQRPVLQARNAPNSEINHSRSYHFARTNWFKSTASYDDVLSVVNAWLKELIEDPDVIDERAEVNLNAVAGIVAHAGNTMEGRSMQYRKETGQIKILDIGMIRYPNISHPYVKVYRIELHAWFTSRTVAGHGSDNNGIYGQFNAKSYVPNETIIRELRESVLDKAVREAEDLFS